jgi:beta-glucosidase
MEGRTYRYYKGEPLWEFGYGLSYTKFNYSNLQLAESVNAGDEVKLSVDVTNSGKMSGEEVVQVYVTDNEASVPVPIRSLAGFKRVDLKPGETKKVEITLRAESFSVIDKDYLKVIEPGDFTISVGGKQPSVVTDASILQAEVNIKGERFVIE